MLALLIFYQSEADKCRAWQKQANPNPQIQDLLTKSQENNARYSLQPIIDWCTYDENTDIATDMDITMESAKEYAVSMKSCMQIAKSFRDTSKGPLS